MVKPNNLVCQTLLPVTDFAVRSSVCLSFFFLKSEKPPFHFCDAVGLILTWKGKKELKTHAAWLGAREAGLMTPLGVVPVTAQPFTSVVLCKVLFFSRMDFGGISALAGAGAGLVSVREGHQQCLIK